MSGWVERGARSEDLKGSSVMGVRASGRAREKTSTCVCA